MSQPVTYLPFDAATVPLRGSNLIEASAGTGKTYSIAILVLRLVLEQKLSVKEVLMVTFTKAAVAELEERIRLFLRKAHKASMGEAVDDELIAALVAQAIKAEGADAVAQRLWGAVLLLDETSVLTIHSFCQQTLAEFAFETGQVFGATLQQDAARLLQDAIQDCWRRKITTLPVPVLTALREAGFCQAAILKVLREHLAGKLFKSYDAQARYDFDPGVFAQWQQQAAELQAAWESLLACLHQKIRDEVAELEALCKSNRYAAAHVDKLADPALFVNHLLTNRSAKYIQQLFAGLLTEIDGCTAAEQRFRDAARQLADPFYCLALQEAVAFIDRYKQQRNILTFDDLISNLHRALVQQDNPELEAALRQKYKAVFIDEFQDTDRQQYEVFSKAFGKHTLLFYIGDPKQSIYAWRKADIFTYFKARSDVDQVYDMDRNFRSSEPMIRAMNNLLLPEPGFDTFFFRDEAAAIDYHEVQSPQPNRKGLLLKEGLMDIPVTVYEGSKKEELYTAMAGQLVQLLDGVTYTIEGREGQRPVRPADIGILVRSNRQAADVKALLQGYGFPAVTVGDDKVLQSEEALQVLYVLQAMEEPVSGNINRALITPLIGFTGSQLLQLDDAAAADLFRRYRYAWQQHGVYKALMDFANHFNVRGRLLQGGAANGERTLTNLVHLTELLHKVQHRNRLSPLELIAWLKRGIEGMETEGDEYEQRVESDEEAIKIVTIHKSKGLEYNIVLAPHLDLLTDEQHIDYVSFRHPDTGAYIAGEKSRLTEAERGWYLRQAEQENRRLFYVALTRAVYKCCLYRSNSRYYQGSTLETFLSGSAHWKPSLVATEAAPEVPAGYHYNQRLPAPVSGVLPVLGGRTVQFRLQQEAWMRSSFTGLSLHKTGSIARSKGLVHADEYDRFVFTELEKGAHTGNLLHALFESVDFSRDTRWEQVIGQVVQRFAPRKAALYAPMLHRMLGEVLGAPITFGNTRFSLGEVQLQERLHEFSFDMRVPRFAPAQLSALSAAGIQVGARNLPEREGLLHGIMDLFFACQGRYYILDWKSNFLGDDLADYGPDQLLQAMNENNYHLQYLLYTYGAVRYLQSRLPDFDYERDFGGVAYLFVRGVRKDGTNGVYTVRPTPEQLHLLEELLADKPRQPAVAGRVLPEVDRVVAE